MAETDFTELDDAYGEPAGQGNNTASKGYVLEPGIEVYPGATEKDIALLRRIGKHLSQSRECQDNE